MITKAYVRCSIRAFATLHCRLQVKIAPTRDWCLADAMVLSFPNFASLMYQYCIGAFTSLGLESEGARLWSRWWDTIVPLISHLRLRRCEVNIALSRPRLWVRTRVIELCYFVTFMIGFFPGHDLIIAEPIRWLWIVQGIRSVTLVCLYLSLLKKIYCHFGISIGFTNRGHKYRVISVRPALSPMKIRGIKYTRQIITRDKM